MTSLVLFLCLFWPLQSHETSHCALLKISKCHNILILKCYFLLLLLLLHEGINTMEKEKSKLRKSITAGVQFCGSSCQRHWLILKLNQSGKGSLSMRRSTRELPTRTHWKVLQKDCRARVLISKKKMKALWNMKFPSHCLQGYFPEAQLRTVWKFLTFSWFPLLLYRRISVMGAGTLSSYIFLLGQL